MQAFELGGQDYITKPFQELEVLMRVRNQLLIKQQYQQLLEQNQRLEHEIQERLKAEAEVRQLSLTDELTGLNNRRGFFLLGNQQFKIVQRTQMFCCVLFVDLDGLKQINDSLGHKIGDRMLVDTAQLLRDFQINNYPIAFKAGEQGAGSRGRESRFDSVKLDNLFLGVP